MAKSPPNIILIGMPGAGKSTVGVLLAKTMGYDFLDTDILIQSHEGRTLQDILDQDDYLSLRAIEEECLLNIAARNTVIATGGSAVYSHNAMQHLGSLGPVVYLDCPFELLQSRINNFSTRGIAKHPEQSFKELYEERAKLYQQYADLSITCNQASAEQTCDKIINELGNFISRS